MFERKDQELSSVRVECDMSIRNPSGDVKEKILYMSLGLKREVCAGDITCLCWGFHAFKTMRLD